MPFSASLRSWSDVGHHLKILRSQLKKKKKLWQNYYWIKNLGKSNIGIYLINAYLSWCLSISNFVSEDIIL